MRRASSGHACVRVILVGPSPASRGGIAQFNGHLADALAKAGASVSVLRLSPLYPSWTRPGRQPQDSSTFPAEQVHVLMPRLVAWRPWTWLRASRALRDERPDVIVFQWWHPMFAPAYAFIAAAAHRTKTRVLFICHNAEPHESFMFARLLTSLAVNQADSLLVLSDAVGDAISRISRKGQVVRLRHPPYTSFLRAESPTAENEWRERIDAGHRRVVLFFGNVRRYKGLEDLIAAFPQVRKEIPAVLVVAGNFFESVSESRRQITELGLQSDVKLFPNYVPDNEVAALFRVADVIVLPYRSGSQTGIAPLAAALGRPLVSTDAGGISEDVPKPAAPAGDPTALAAAIVASLRHPATDVRRLATWKQWAETVLSFAPAARDASSR